MALVLAYARMMPRIEAGERLAAIGDGAIAAGTMRELDKERQLQRLEQAAAGQRKAPAKATPAALRAMGIGTRNPASAAPEKAVNDG